MNANQRIVAASLREAFDKAHLDAVTSTGVSDHVFAVQDAALGMVKMFGRMDPDFDEQEFLSLAINQPGITNAWDPQ